MAALPPVRLLAPLVDAAHDFAMTELRELPKGQPTSPLEGRLAKWGTWGGAAGEALVYCSKDPEYIAVNLLLSDGDPSRKNRKFVLHDTVKVARVHSNDTTHRKWGVVAPALHARHAPEAPGAFASSIAAPHPTHLAPAQVAGFAMAEHCSTGLVGCLSLFTLFAYALEKEVHVTCQGTSTAEFDEVLDAIPSDEVREIANSALGDGKSVTLDYTIVELKITVTESSGDKQVYALPLK